MSDSSETQPDLTFELHVACMLNDPDRVTDLLARGADPEGLNGTGATVIEMADFLQRLEVTKRLLAHINIVEAGSVELLKAIRLNRPTVVRALLEMGLKDQLSDGEFFKGILILSCCTASSNVVEMLVKYGPGISMVQNEQLLLHVAAVAKSMDVIEFIRKSAEEERLGSMNRPPSAQVNGVHLHNGASSVDRI
ncbi:ANK [Aspergillus sclerotialis]|uniref:ANK n=1 Tax=Aspergillus sclerotialis TaxID=2070753 RepID=A0A3A2ZH48_9EURO|nr:ANK [Aspergillus sclerotialis]